MRVHPALADGSHGGGTRPGTAGLGFPGATLPDPQLPALAINYVEKADIDPCRKARVMFNFWT